MKQKACDTKYTFNRSASLIDLVYVSRRTRRLRSAYAHSFLCLLTIAPALVPRFTLASFATSEGD